MSGLVSRLTRALVLACGCLAVAGCADNGAGVSDGGGGAGGSGGAITDAAVDTGLVGCVTMGSMVCPTPPVTYANVQPIFAARCVSVCHNDRTIDPATNMPIWALNDYDHIVDWADLIRSSIVGCTMPPQDAGVPVTVEDRRAILDWIRCGYPK